MGLWHRIAAAYRHEIVEQQGEARLLSAVAFLLTFLLARIVTGVLKLERGGGGLEIAGLHVHHVVFGIALLLLFGVLDVNGLLPRVSAVLFGIGSALVLDEFALVLNLADVYWQPQGRESVDAAIIFAAVLWLLFLAQPLWRAVLRRA
jgi:lysyl-tRNA synthetase, class II